MPRQKMVKTPLTVQERTKRIQEIDREKQMLLMQQTQDEVAKNVLDYLRQQVSKHKLDYQDTVFALFHCIMSDDEIFGRNGIDY